MTDLLIVGAYTVAMMVLGALLATAGLVTASIARYNTRERLAGGGASEMRSEARPEARAEEVVVLNRGQSEERKVAQLGTDERRKAA